MSLFGKSLERELGKNTGKFVSNLIFGDGHATPYRRAESRRQQQLNQQTLREENLHEQRLTQIKFENMLQQKEQLLAIDSAVLQNVDAISSIRISNNGEEIVNLLLELSIQFKANKWYGISEEGKIRNKYNDALLEKYNQAFLRLKTIDASNYQLEYFENNLRNFRKKKFLKQNQIYLILAAVAVAIFFIYLIQEERFGIIFSLIAILAIAMVGYRFYKHNQIPLTQKATDIKKTHEEGEKIVEKVIREEDKLNKQSIFFDLNDNGRIEDKLSKIWERYSDNADSQLIKRKPIFSADGVFNSILFIGINPSFNLSDDNTLIKSNDGNSLMYGSFYQRSDAPDYFKVLEHFANGFNKGYTHINLLYAREDDRDLLLNCDHNFIREQLELTYDTILKIKPFAIFFFSDYCKDLIFGADRWVIPNDELNGRYILNGTNYPVFFTSDITSMTDKEQVELIDKVKMSI